MKALLPWLCVVGLAIGLGWVYSASQKKDAELAALREESQQLQKLRAELEETKGARTQAESDELVRLRKDNEDLLRLRNEVGQLRKEKQQLAAQVQTAQAQAQGAQDQVQALRANPAQAAAPGSSARAQAALAGRPGVPRSDSRAAASQRLHQQSSANRWGEAAVGFGEAKAGRALCSPPRTWRLISRPVRCPPARRAAFIPSTRSASRRFATFPATPCRSKIPAHFYFPFGLRAYSLRYS